MKRFVYLLTAAVFVLLLISCNSTTEQPDAEEFSIRISVRDSLGNPVPNLVVSYLYDIGFGNEKPVYSKGKNNRPYTIIPLLLNIPHPTYVDINISDMENHLIKKLCDNTYMAPAHHQLVWDGTDSLSQNVTNGMYKVKMIFNDSELDTSALNDSIYMWVNALYDMGHTDAQGKYIITDRKSFPGLYTIPPMDITDENSNVIANDYQPGREIKICLSNPETETECWYDVEYLDGVNLYNLTWINEGIPFKARAKNYPVTQRNRSGNTAKDSYGLRQNYPNPFN